MPQRRAQHAHFRVHATDQGGSETAIANGGLAHMPMVNSEAPVVIFGSHTAAIAGTTRIRVLGKVSGVVLYQIGLLGIMSLRVDHFRSPT